MERKLKEVYIYFQAFTLIRGVGSKKRTLDMRWDENISPKQVKLGKLGEKSIGERFENKKSDLLIERTPKDLICDTCNAFLASFTVGKAFLCVSSFLASWIVIYFLLSTCLV